ncbi:TPA: hypothetical protein ACP6IR_003752 [Clostridioides difficile]|nr:hypothetical protein [Clostridioides difficile]MDV9709056.1 hypothetical protein [Clostridioides difficile]HBE9110524.1 hypothetical protein [Clostridioides difficile]HBH3565171.1 hypothetical protein [Clostridioides difficile]HBH3581809.1 hypothetical protein [Clostridioides difficile]
MSSKTYFDTYNIFNLARHGDTNINIGLLSESLILNENIIINMNNPKSSLKKLITKCEEENLMMLIRSGVVSFNYDFFPFKLVGLHKEQNKICKLILENYKEDLDIEKEVIEGLKETVNNKKKIKKIKNTILDNFKQTDFSKIKKDEMHKFICNNINNNQVIYAILKANRPYNEKLEYFRNLNYKVECENDSYYIYLLSDHNDEDIKEAISVFGSSFLTTIMRSYISIVSAEHNGCKSLWGSKSTEALFEANLNVRPMSNITENYRNIVRLEKCPDIVDEVNSNNLDFKKILKMRKKAENLRKVLEEFKDEEDTIDFLAEYIDRSRKEDKMFESIPCKTIRFALGSMFLPYAFFDTFLLQSTKAKVCKTIKISNILE